MRKTSKSPVPSLNQTFAEQDISIALTEAGLLVDRAESVVQLYAEHHNWAGVKAQWHGERIHERGSRSSAQKIFRIIKRRLQAGGNALPSMASLSVLLRQCPTTQAKAQLLYFYLLEQDNLFRFVLHEVLRRQGVERDHWDVSFETVGAVLRAFRYRDGAGLSYASSTLERWAQGFRSVLRDVGVIKKPYDDEGTVPTVDFPSLHVGALYSYNLKGKEWLERPVGWWYLFQPRANREAMFDRLRTSDHWSVSQVREQTILIPAGAESQVL